MKLDRITGFIFLGALVVASCAKIGSPSGGPKDVVPPKVVQSVPENGSTNFTGNKFTVIFDEYVNTDKVTETLMVSPPLGKRPTVAMKGKSVTVEFDEKLKDSATYTFYFQDAIKDLNEGNPLENFQYVFSTGNVIDSLSFEGYVYNSQSLDPLKEVLVLLYTESNDTAFQKQLPDYITKASDEGYFRIDNVKAGQYKLYGLIDQDNSKNFNLSDEVVAFLDTTVVIAPETNYYGVSGIEKIDSSALQVDSLATSKGTIREPDPNFNLYLFQHEKTARYLTSSVRPSATELLYCLSRPTDGYEFDFSIAGTDEKGFLLEKSFKGDTLWVWLTDTAYSNRQSLKTVVKYPFTDSLGIVITKADTITLRYSAPRTTLRGQAQTIAEPYKISANFSSGKISPLTKLVLTAPVPFGTMDTSKITLYSTTNNQKAEQPFSIERDTINIRKLNIITDLKRGVEYFFVADSASISDIFGLVTDSLGYKFSVNGDDKYGKLVFRISGYDGPRIFQLISEKEDKIIREIYSEKDGTIEIPYIDKGKYKARLIYDLNGDKKWTTGDFSGKRQPEPVSYFPTLMDVKVNWEQIFDWNIGAFNQKENRNIPTK